MGKRIPLFLNVQAACLTCGVDVTDPLRLEEFGRYCSPRCYHARGLPVVFRVAG